MSRFIREILGLDQKANAVWSKKKSLRQTLNRGLHQLLEIQALKTPQDIALIRGSESLTYSDLNLRSNIVANYLNQVGAQPGTLIGVCLENSFDLLSSLIGILKSGCAYVPLDPNFPSNRLEYILQDSQAKFVLTHSRLQDKIKRLSNSLCNVILVDNIPPDLKKTVNSVTQPFDAESLAYVIYTSGSTGKPKGVMITHRSLINFLLYMVNKLEIKNTDKLLAVTTYCFDIAGLELFLPLLSGAKCILCDHETAKNADLLREALQQYQPTFMQATPATWAMLFQSGWENKENIRILCGGELLTESLKQAFLRTTDEVWNVYGPTETTIWSTIKRVCKEDSSANIGKPIANTEILILDDLRKPVNQGEIGEICIAGDGLAKGYYNQPDLTADKFIKHPHNPDEKIYRTGDLGRILDTDEVEYLGRIDYQVKIRGYRIELGEIENSLSQHPMVKECVVVVKEHQENKQLVAYVTINDQHSYNAQTLRDYLSENLPEYMVPSFIVCIEKLPLTPNLKVDRKFLTDLKLDFTLKSNENQEKTTLQQNLKEIWEKLLNIKFDDLSISFFDLGGNSALAATLADKINKTLNLKLTVTNIFKHNSIEKICDYILNEKDKNLISQSESNKKDPSNLYNFNEIAVVGMVGKFPMADNLDEFWSNVVQGKNCMSEIPNERWDWDAIYGDSKKEAQKTKVKWGGFINGIKEFDPMFFDISPHEAELMDPQQRLLLTHTWLALEHAGISPSEFSKINTGVFIAAAPNYHYDSLIGNKPENNPYLTTNTSLSIIANRISHFFNLRGPSEICEATCSSSFVALHRALQSIQLGECHQAIVGAINLILSPKMTISYDSADALSQEKEISSFQKNANGYLRSEGVAVCILKPLNQAIADNDNIYCIIKGSSALHGGRGTSLTAPNQYGIETAMIEAYRKAQIDSKTISYIEAHGIASPIGDSIEIDALKSAYEATMVKEQKQSNLDNKCYISSLKPCIGHSEITSGLASLFKAILAMNHKVIPGLPNFQFMSDQIDLSDSPFQISPSNQQWLAKRDGKGEVLPRRASVNTYGFGVNAHVLIEEYLKEKSYEDHDAQDLAPQLIILSAKRQDRLIAMIENLLRFIDRNPAVPLTDIAYTLQVGRAQMKKRFSCIVSTNEELKNSLIQILNNPASLENESISEIDRSLTNDYQNQSQTTTIESALSDRELNYLANIWRRGVDIEWKKLTRARLPQRVILPGYIFSKDEYWVMEDKASTQDASKKIQNYQSKIIRKDKKRICIIGAGPSGLVMAKSLLEEGHDPIIYEKQEKLGGVWNINKDKICGVYKKTQFQNSKDTSFFSDFYPQDTSNIFLSETEVRRYLQQYSEKFNLAPLCNFNSTVLSIEKNASGKWEVEVSQSNHIIHEEYDGIAMCHGRYSFPFIPNIPGLGTFKGKIIHSGQYVDNAVFKDKRVLVIGNGVSGLDIAEDAVETASEVIWCMRSLKLILPRMVGFLPNDYISPANLFVAGNNSLLLERLKDSMPQYFEDYKKSGLFPTKEDFEEYPFIHINDNVVNLVSEGKIKAIVGDISQITNEDCVIKQTGETLNHIDTIVFCTGYNNNKNFGYLKNISVKNDFAMGLFYAEDPTLVNSYGLNDVGTTGTFPYLEMVARWYAQIISGKYQLSSEEIRHRVDPKDIIVAPIANVVMGLKLGLLPNPRTSFKEFWKLLKYPSFSMIYRMIGPHSDSDLKGVLAQCVKRSLIPDEKNDPHLRTCKYRILAGLEKDDLESLLKTNEITQDEYKQAFSHANSPILLNWDLQYIKRKSKPSHVLINEIKVTEWLKSEDDISRSLSTDEFTDKLKHILTETLKLNPNDINMDDSLSSYGVSSVTLRLLADKISDAFPTVGLSPTTFIEHPTLKDLSQYLFNKYKVKQSSQEPISTVDIQSRHANILGSKESRDESVNTLNQTENLEDVNDNDIAIIGIGGKFPDSNNLLSFWDKLVKGDTFFDKIPNNRWDWQRYYGSPEEINKTDCCYGSFINDIEAFDNELFDISSEEAPFIDPQHRLVLETTWETLENAGYSKDNLNGKKVGFFLGIERQDYLHLIKENGHPIAGYFNTGNSHSMLANHVSHFFGWTGPNAAIDAACCSSFSALQQAITSIRIGQSEMAIAGGAHLLLSPDIYISNRKLGLFTNKEQVQPFDQKASGHYFGESIAFVFLKRLSRAYQDRDHIFGIIKGVSIRHGGKSVYLTAPNAESHRDTIREALADARLNSSDIDCIEAQGTANPLSDTIELKAYHHIFPNKNKVLIGTLKGHTGHLAGASGVVSLIKMLMSLKNNYLIRIANFKSLNWPSDEDAFNCEIIEHDMDWYPKGSHTQRLPRRVGIHNFSFGGLVGHLILEESINHHTEIVNNENIQDKELIILSASTSEQLNERVNSLYKYIENKKYQYFGFKDISLTDIAYTLQVGRQAMNHRVVFCVSTLSQLLVAMADFLKGNIDQKTTLTGNIKDYKDSQREFFSNEMQDRLKQWLAESNLWQLGQLWIKGVSIDWEAYYQVKPAKRIVLPTYPFKRTKFWIDTACIDSKANLRPISYEPERDNAKVDRTTKDNTTVLNSFYCIDDRNERLTFITNYFVGLFSKILKISHNDLNLDENLINLGIDSLRWQIIKENVANDLHYILSSAALIENINIKIIVKKIIDHLNNNLQSERITQQKLEHDSSSIYMEFPLTDTQESFIVGRSFNCKDAIDAIIYLEIEEDELDIHRLTRAWNMLYQYHPMLRANVTAAGQIIQEECNFYEIKTQDLSKLSQEEQQSQLNKIRAQLRYKIYKDDDFPLFDICISKLSSHRSIIHLSISELIADAESLRILLKQWYQLYLDLDATLPELTINFRDYVNYFKNVENTDEYQASVNYWINKFTHLPQGPNLSVTEVTSQASYSLNKRHRIIKKIKKETWTKLKQKSVEIQITPSVLLFTIFSDLLRTIATSNRFSIILTTSGRLPAHQQISSIVGPFLSTFLFEVKKDTAENFSEKLTQYQKEFWECLDHSKVSGIKVLRELKKRSLIGKDFSIPVVFTSLLPGSDRENQVDNSPWERALINQESLLLTPQVYFEHQCLEQDGDLYLIFDLAEKVYNKDIIDPILDRYENYLIDLVLNEEGFNLNENPFLKSTQVRERHSETSSVNFTIHKADGNEFAPFDLTDMQSSYLFNRLVNQENNVISGQIYYENELSGVDVSKLNQALNKVIKHHEMLRAIVFENGSQQYQKSARNYHIKVNDLTGHTDENVQRYLMQERQRHYENVLPLNRWPLFEITTSQLKNGNIVLHSTFDFLLYDMTSAEIIFRDLTHVLSSPNTELEQLDFTYRDYLTSLDHIFKNDTSQKSLYYWESKFSDIPSGPKIPSQFYNSRVTNLKRSRVSIKIDHYEQLGQGILSFAPLSMIMLTAYAETISHFLDSDPFSIVVVNWDRPQIHRNINDIVGDFTRLSWLDYFPNTTKSFKDKLKEVYECWLEDQQHSLVSGLKALRKRMCYRDKPGLKFPIVFTNFSQEISNPVKFSQSTWGLSQTLGVYMDLVMEIKEQDLIVHFDILDDVFTTNFMNEFSAYFLNLVSNLMHETTLN